MNSLTLKRYELIVNYMNGLNKENIKHKQKVMNNIRKKWSKLENIIKKPL